MCYKKCARWSLKDTEVPIYVRRMILNGKNKAKNFDEK